MRVCVSVSACELWYIEFARKYIYIYRMCTVEKRAGGSWLCCWSISFVRAFLHFMCCCSRCPWTSFASPTPLVCLNGRQANQPRTYAYAIAIAWVMPTMGHTLLALSRIAKLPMCTRECSISVTTSVVFATAANEAFRRPMLDRWGAKPGGITVFSGRVQ